MPLLYFPDGNKFADKRFIRCFAKSWFAGYCPGYSLILWNEKEGTAWRETCGFITRGRSMGCNFDFYAYCQIFRDARERVRCPDVPVTIHVLHPPGKTFDELVGTTTTCHPCRGRIYRDQFSMLARSLIALTLIYSDTRVRMHADAWESRVGYLPRIHRADCSAWIFIRLFEASHADDDNDDRKSPVWKKVLRASKSGRVCCRDSISFLNATKNVLIECPWCSYCRTYGVVHW